MIPKIQVKAVEVPEWDFPVFVRKWSIGQRANVFAAVRAAETPEQIARANVDVVINSACDQSGKLLFDEPDRATLEEDAWVIDRIADAARALNLVEKKSDSTQSENSSSSLPPTSA